MTRTLLFIVLIFLAVITIAKRKRGIDKFMDKFQISSSKSTIPKVYRTNFKGLKNKDLKQFDDYKDFIKSLNENEYSNLILQITCCSNSDNTIALYHAIHENTLDATTRKLFPSVEVGATSDGTCSGVSASAVDYINQLYVNTDPINGLTGLRATTKNGQEMVCGLPANEPLLPADSELYGIAAKFDSAAIRAIAAYYIKHKTNP